MASTLHPIRVVSRRTGLPQELLRAWERRYEAVVPQRTETGRRMYTDFDIARLNLLKRAIDAGRRIGEVASLPQSALEELVANDRSESGSVVGSGMGSVNGGQVDSGAAPGEAGEFLERCLEAVANLDRRGLESLLAQASLALSPARMRSQLLLPLMHMVGDRWRQGSLRVANEHFASAVVRSHLANLPEPDLPVGAGPRLVVATPAGQLHEFGALMVAATAADLGWEVLYLGPNLPAEEIAVACRQHQAHAVALSVVYPAQDPHLHEQFRRLRSLLGDDIAVLVGGRSVAAYRDTLAEVDIQMPADLDETARLLEDLAG